MKKVLIFLCLSTMLFACDNNEQQSARVEVRLTDAPADYDAVNIDIKGVEVHSEEGETESGWKTLNVQAGVYNLLQLTNGLDTLLATAELPVGKISQIRIILGEDNSIIVNGQELPLSTPSAMQSGLKINVHTELKAGITYEILLDFDAHKSVLQTSNGSYKLKPVIRSITNAQTGAISGSVTPVAASPVIYAILNSDTLATTTIAEGGNFLLRGLPEGVYTVAFEPIEGYSAIQKGSINVVVGNVAELGQVTIP